LSCPRNEILSGDGLIYPDYTRLSTCLDVYDLETFHDFHGHIILRVYINTYIQRTSYYCEKAFRTNHSMFLYLDEKDLTGGCSRVMGDTADPH